jgi:hypothetical protein
MNWIINYLLLGILVMWALDYISRKVSDNPNQLFTQWERIVLIIGWPVYLITFIVMFLVTFFKNK